MSPVENADKALQAIANDSSTVVPGDLLAPSLSVDEGETLNEAKVKTDKETEANDLRRSMSSSSQIDPSIMYR
jgi:outer membrane protein assembly factor BamA